MATINPGVVGILLGGTSSKKSTKTNLPSFDFCDVDSPIAGFHVIGSNDLANCPVELRWCIINNDDIDVDGFKVYKSFIGFKTDNEAPFGLSKGDTLKLKVNNQDFQKISFAKDYTITELVDFLNKKLEGATASKDANSNALIVRSDLEGDGAFIEIFGGSALSKMGLKEKTISERSEFNLIATISDNEIRSYVDVNGRPCDHYSLAVVSDKVEYKKTPEMQPVKYQGNICVIEGFLYTANGIRVQDIEVTARVVTPPERFPPGGYVVDSVITSLSDKNGKFALPVLQGASILFEINKARISDPVIVPKEPFIYFDKLMINQDYKLKDLVNNGAEPIVSSNNQ